MRYARIAQGPRHMPSAGLFAKSVQASISLRRFSANNPGRLALSRAAPSRVPIQSIAPFPIPLSQRALMLYARSSWQRHAKNQTFLRR